MDFPEIEKLIEDSKNWTDASDWKDNIPRLKRLFKVLPQILEEHQCYEIIARDEGYST